MEELIKQLNVVWMNRVGRESWCMTVQCVWVIRSMKLSEEEEKKKTTSNVRTCFILQTEERSTANRVTNNTDTVLFAISGLPSKAEAGHIRFCLIFMARVTLSRCNSIYSCDLFMLCLCDSAGGWPPSMVNLNTLDHHRSSSLWQEYISASRHDRSKQLENHNLALRHFCDSVDITTWKKTEIILSWNNVCSLIQKTQMVNGYTTSSPHNAAFFFSCADSLY